MDINDLTLGQIRELQGMLGGATTPAAQHPYTLYGKYLIRTVTHIQTGELVDVTDKELVLKNAAWIADTGRFGDNLISCSFNEVEMFPADKLVIVGRGAIIDAVQIAKLPTETK